MITLVGDTEIAFDDIGSGFPVVFLHAFPLNRTMWEPQVTALVGEFRCITIDMPKSPCSMALSQRQYCIGSGSFRPSLASSCATAAGVANSPRIA